jgi:hypothetical protein
MQVSCYRSQFLILYLPQYTLSKGEGGITYPSTVYKLYLSCIVTINICVPLTLYQALFEALHTHFTHFSPPVKQGLYHRPHFTNNKTEAY